MEPLTEADPPRIGGYVLVARLGAGGMGQVYLGRSPGGRLVAVKVVRGEIVGHPEALARFRREVETVRAVRSAYTASLIDASLEDAPYWLATEYVAGPTLAEAVRERGPLGAGTCRGVAAALAEGLASVHAYGVTHRDLKPQNVILGAQGPQLIDFGIARGVGTTALTQAGQAPGTPGYTAPEVLLGAVAGAAADVFALGATLAYAATGRPPYGAGAAAGVGYRTVHEPVDVAGVEAGLAALIESCVAKDPSVRPGPAEVIRRCGVRGALVEDPGYGAAALAPRPGAGAGASGGGATRTWAGLPDGGSTAVGWSGEREAGGPGAAAGAATRAWPRGAAGGLGGPAGGAEVSDGASADAAARTAVPRERDALRDSGAGMSAEEQARREASRERHEAAAGAVPREREAAAAGRESGAAASGPVSPERGAAGGTGSRAPEAGGGTASREPGALRDNGAGIPVASAAPRAVSPEREDAAGAAPREREVPGDAGAGMSAGPVVREAVSREHETGTGTGADAVRRDSGAASRERGSVTGAALAEREAAPGAVSPVREAPAGAGLREREAGARSASSEPETPAGAASSESETPAGAGLPEREAGARSASPEPETPAGSASPERATPAWAASPEPEVPAGGAGLGVVGGAVCPVVAGESGRAGAPGRRWGRRLVVAVLLVGAGAGGVWAVGRAGEWAGGARASESGAPGAGDSPGTGAGGVGTPGASAPAGAGATPGQGKGGSGRKAVDYRWKLSSDPLMAEYGAGECTRPAEGEVPGGGIETQTVTSRTGGVPSATAKVRMRPKAAADGANGADGGARAAGGSGRPGPFPVRVAVRPPSAQPPAGGGPAGFLSAPVDLFGSWDSGDYVELTYPDDFPGAVPLAGDRGDWTVVFYRVEDGAGKYEGISCSGFNVAR